MASVKYKSGPEGLYSYQIRIKSGNKYWLETLYLPFLFRTGKRIEIFNYDSERYGMMDVSIL
jgi:hypothetical protein